ncbi:MAG: hypothetical protein D8G53_03225, partial [Candidatus Saccharimonas sp.]
IYNQARCINDIDLLSWFYVSVAGVCEGNVKWAGIIWLFFLKLRNSLLQVIQLGVEFAGACYGAFRFCIFSFSVFPPLSLLPFASSCGNIRRDNNARYCNR